MQRTEQQARQAADEQTDGDLAGKRHNEGERAGGQRRQLGRGERHYHGAQDEGERQAHAGKDEGVAERRQQHECRTEAGEHDEEGEDVGGQRLGEHAGA